MPNRRTVLMGSIGAAVAFGLRAYGQSPDNASSDDIVREPVKNVADKAGIVAVVVDESGSQIIAHGHTGMPDNPPLTDDTVFEVGSITKVMTALLLADMAARGEVAMSDPLAKYLP